MTTALIDGDIVCYRCAAVNEDVDEGIAKWQADELVTRILSDTQSDSSRIFISGDNNFRYQLFPDYKANRRDKPKPRHLEAIRENLLLNWGGEVVNDMEADDALGIAQTTETRICSIDKDLLQIPGAHYNFVRREMVDVSTRDGWYNFYIQVLTGDPSDNIKGCRGIGKVRAPKVLENCSDEIAMHYAVANMYLAQKQTLEEMELACQLLYILRSEEDKWTPPQERQSRD